MKHPWQETAAGLGISLPRDAPRLLDRYVHLIHERGIPLGIVSGSDTARLLDRHIIDSLRGAADLSDARRVADLGSGAGLPGVPLAIALPDCGFVLCDVRRQRAAFLELVVDDLGLGPRVTVSLGTAASLASGNPTPFDAVVARAFADLSGTWAAALPLLRAGGTVHYWAGESFDPSDVPPDVASVTVRRTTALANAGPVVIMGRQ